MAEVKSLPLTAWPQADRDAWAAVRSAGDIFDDGGGAAHWRSSTVKNFEQDYGLWLGWLAAHGMLSGAPGERVTQANVEAYVTDLRERQAAVSVANQVRRLYRAMQLFAPQHDWKWLKDLKARLRRDAEPSKPKPDALTHPAELYTLGMRLMDEAETDGTLKARRAAVAYRDGLIIAILAARAPRRQEFTDMRLDVNLRHDGGAYWLVFSAAETKQKRASEHRLPDDLTARVDRYLEHHREVLAAGPRNAEPREALWLTEFGDALSAMAVNVVVRKHTAARLGIPIPPHRFRDCLATAWALDLPEHVRMAGTMLDHHDPSMTEAHYNQAQRHRALRAHASTISRLRDHHKAGC
ncbi:hypothetical protein CKO28_18505 [Rhodovibrio sodomensis]|uniref:Tyr recombinase domain-containing protein n=1 Tax=Rhodovibrio sodomensis TaxID=1088 RepID=A0ABS1DHV9_9PROT|nr:hypothetical protein [Rhodovibrio sodomensis]MBK1670029.1 hypothetical protein [Rhodovibrio sodomensis]